jgi:hypothetical protein
MKENLDVIFAGLNQANKGGVYTLAEANQVLVAYGKINAWVQAQEKANDLASAGKKVPLSKMKK